MEGSDYIENFNVETFENHYASLQSLNFSVMTAVDVHICLCLSLSALHITASRVDSAFICHAFYNPCIAFRRCSAYYSPQSMTQNTKMIQLHFLQLHFILLMLTN